MSGSENRHRIADLKRVFLAALPALVLAGVPTSGAAQTIAGCGTTAIAKAEDSDRTKLGNNADCFGKAKVVAIAAEAVRRDRITALPPPAPVFVPTPTVAPTLEGIAPIASGVKVADHLMPAWGTGGIAQSAAADREGAFRFLCAPSHNAYDDPIVYPGQPGKSHLHTFFGNTKADANSTYQSLRTTGDSTCNNLLNRSAYWIAALMNGRGKVVMPDYVSIYYKGLPSSGEDCRKVARACIPLPRGLRYIFGYNMLNAARSDPINNRWWNCDSPAPGASGHFANIAQAARNCPVGARIGMVMTGPDCWNGKDLDSADHRSHLAFTAQNGNGVAVCPRTHPYLLPHFTIGAWYTTDATLDRSGDESATASTWFLASDRMQGMTPAVPGTTLHADWFGAWEDNVLDVWQRNCIDKMLSCSGGDLGDGTQMKTTFGYDMASGRPLLDPPPAVMAMTMPHQ